MPAFRTGTKGRLRPVRPVGAEVESLARELGLDGGLKLHRLQIKWKGLFHKGPLSRHAWPVQLRDGRLTIHADSPPWMQQLSFLKQEILSKLQPFGVSEISIRIGRTFQEHTVHDEGERIFDEELPPAEEEAIEEVILPLVDDELKGQVRRAMRAWARRKRAK